MNDKSHVVELSVGNLLVCTDSQREWTISDSSSKTDFPIDQGDFVIVDKMEIIPVCEGVDVLWLTLVHIPTQYKFRQTVAFDSSLDPPDFEKGSLMNISINAHSLEYYGLASV